MATHGGLPASIRKVLLCNLAGRVIDAVVRAADAVAMFDFPVPSA